MKKLIDQISKYKNISIVKVAWYVTFLINSY